MGRFRDAAATATSRSLSNPQSATDISTLSLDAGIFLTNRDGYLCFELGRVRLHTDARVSSIKSSCESVKLVVIAYMKPQGTSIGVLLRFAPTRQIRSISDHSTSHDIAPINLGVSIEMLLADCEPL